MPYSKQIAEKRDRVASLLSPFFRGNLQSYESPPVHYRARAEFRIWHEGDVCSYAMGNMTKDGAVTITECPKVTLPIQKRMWRLLEKINASPDGLKKRLFSVEFLATTTDECFVTMLYHRKLDEAWSSEAREIEKALECCVIGRSRKQRVVLSNAYVTEALAVDNIVYRYRHYEGGFTQPNPVVNRAMIAWATEQAKSIGKGDLLESYCGLGNFTLPLSRLFDKVLATEVSKNSINAAKENCLLNGVENIIFVRLSSEEMTQALGREREFTRLHGVSLDSYDFTCVLVDPPRAGLDDATIDLISTLENIIYISCNPETLARDLKTLTQTHVVESAALFDQFPHTTHVESGVFLRKKHEQ